MPHGDSELHMLEHARSGRASKSGFEGGPVETDVWGIDVAPIPLSPQILPISSLRVQLVNVLDFKRQPYLKGKERKWIVVRQCVLPSPSIDAHVQDDECASSRHHILPRTPGPVPPSTAATTSSVVHRPLLLMLTSPMLQS